MCIEIRGKEVLISTANDPTIGNYGELEFDDPLGLKIRVQTDTAFKQKLLGALMRYRRKMNHYKKAEKADRTLTNIQQQYGSFYSSPVRKELIEKPLDLIYILEKCDVRITIFGSIIPTSERQAKDWKRKEEWQNRHCSKCTEDPERYHPGVFCHKITPNAPSREELKKDFCKFEDSPKKVK
jgi:hypothetical protein